MLGIKSSSKIRKFHVCHCVKCALENLKGCPLPIYSLPWIGNAKCGKREWISLMNSRNKKTQQQMPKKAKKSNHGREREAMEGRGRGCIKREGGGKGGKLLYALSTKNSSEFMDQRTSSFFTYNVLQ